MASQHPLPLSGYLWVCTVSSNQLTTMLCSTRELGSAQVKRRSVKAARDVHSNVTKIQLQNSFDDFIAGARLVSCLSLLLDRLTSFLPTPAVTATDLQGLKA